MHGSSPVASHQAAQQACTLLLQAFSIDESMLVQWRAAGSSVCSHVALLLHIVHPHRHALQVLTEADVAGSGVISRDAFLAFAEQHEQILKL